MQMVAEQVTIEVLRVKGTRDTGLPIANVIASFTMRNTGNAAETMTVRFPLSDLSGWGDGFGGHPEIAQVIVTVNGKRMPTRVVTTPNPRGGSEPPIRWAAFDATFPPGKDVAIDVQYILQSTGYMPYGRFKYILETGAGWAGPIGLATFILKLPYPANEENVVLGQSTPGGQFFGDEVRWTFKDIEPTEQDNFYVTVLAPSVWERILEARQRTEAAPKSATAWRELAQAYLSAIFGKYSPEIGANFVPLIEEAYRRAQENDPTSAQLHAEWAQTLLSLYPPIFELDPTIVEKILAALKAAFERDPSNPLAQKVLSDMRDWLTQRAKSSGAEAETAKKQLEALDQIAQETGVDRLVATPTAAPTPESPEATTTPAMPEVTPTTEAILPAVEPITSSTIVTSATEANVVITSTVVSTVTTTLTDTATSRPVVVVIVQESRAITETADITGTVPATVTETSATTVVTTTTPSEAAPAASVVITATIVTTTTKALDETGAVKPESPGVITSTAVTTVTTEASPLAPTQPATVTVITAQTTISPTGMITRPTETGEPTAVETTVTSSVISTATTGITEPGVLPGTSIITQTEVVTTTIEPARTEGAPPVINVITETTVVTTTVDSSGVVTPGTPVIVIATSAPPGLPATPQAVAAEPTATPATPPTSEATAVAEAATPASAAEVTPAAQEAAATAPSAAQGTSPVIWLALLLTYIVGGAATYGIHSLMIRRDRERAAQHAEGQEQMAEQAPDSTTDQPSADL